MTRRPSHFLFLFLGVMVGLVPSLVMRAEAINAPDQPIGAPEIRALVREFMAMRGLPAPQDRDIWPLDDRLSLSPCDHKPEISARSARSNSYIVHCNGPQVWDYTIRVEVNGMAPAPSAGAKASPSAVSQPVLPSSAEMRAVSVPESGEKVEKASIAPSFPVVVPRVDLAAGTILTADMLEIRSMPQSPGMTAFRTVKEAVGLRLTANVGPSSVLNTRNVAKAPQVLKGENVTIIAGGSGFEIIAPGKAETDGYEGDLITVKNAKTGVKLTGKLGPGATVLVK
jgi:flagella basal body P-ring formation protein FlgA